MYKKRKNEREQRYLKELNLTPNWPVFQVVVPGAVGIYDDLILAAKDTRGMNMHFCTKYRAIECIDDMEGYYRYHFPNEKYADVKITEKNRLFKMGVVK